MSEYSFTYKLSICSYCWSTSKHGSLSSVCQLGQTRVPKCNNDHNSSVFLNILTSKGPLFYDSIRFCAGPPRTRVTRKNFFFNLLFVSFLLSVIKTVGWGLQAAHLVECLPSMRMKLSGFEHQGCINLNAKAHLQSQHLGDRSRKIRNSKLAFAAE